MELKITKRKNGTRRVQSIPKGASMTDQSDANYLDINNIMKNYAKTGLLPQFKEKVAQYLDVSNAPSYIEAHDQIQAAKKLFDALPSAVRKLMDNDPAKLEETLKDPKNYDFLVQHGVLKEIQKPHSSVKPEETVDEVKDSKAKEPKGDAKSAQK
jgi:phage internal scaffolding protein